MACLSLTKQSESSCPLRNRRNFYSWMMALRQQRTTCSPIVSSHYLLLAFMRFVFGVQHYPSYHLIRLYQGAVVTNDKLTETYLKGMDGILKTIEEEQKPVEYVKGR